MKIYFHSTFFKKFKKLPRNVRSHTKEKIIIFKKDPLDPSLGTHKLHGKLKDFFAFSITNKYRVIFDFVDKSKVRFMTIDTHDVYK